MVGKRRFIDNFYVDDRPQPSLLEAARAYHAKGYRVVPVRAGSKAPMLRRWQRDLVEVEAFSAHFADGGNIGILLGEPSGWLVDVDLDCPEAVELAPEFLPSTAAKMGRGANPNAHFLYIARGAITKKHKDPVTRKMLVELRSTGTQSLVGPSVHPSGDRYTMLDGEPTEVDADYLAACVEQLAEEVIRRRYPRGVPNPSACRSNDAERGGGAQSPIQTARMTAPDDEDTLRRARAYLQAIPAAIAGQGGHNQTFIAARMMVHGFALDPKVALELLKQYSQRCDPPWSDKELEHKVNEAMTRPFRKPYGWLRDARSGAVDDTPDTNGLKKASRDIQILGDAKPDQFPCTDWGNAERFAQHYGSDFRYFGRAGQWLAWNGRCWHPAEKGETIRSAGELARRMYAEALAQQSEEQRKWARNSESKYKLEAMVKLAGSLLAVTADELDADDWLLNVQNGTLDLRTDELRPHRREDYITRAAPVAYDPAARCQLFERFMRQITRDDSDLADFILRYAGFSLTGDIREQILPIFHGVGGNGKNVLLDTIMGLMGEYASIAAPDLLTQTKVSRHPTELADLRGRRLVIVSETEEGATLRMQLVKKLTGDSTIKARHMREDFYEFRRTSKLILVTNNLPRIDEHTHAVWRRLLVVPFNMVISGAEVDPLLPFKLTAERPGILNLLLRSCRQWRSYGLGTAPAILEATAAYRREQDLFAGFIDDRCVIGGTGSRESRDHFVTCSRLYEAYEAWCRRQDVRALSPAALGAALTRRGVGIETRRVDGKSCKVRVGITLRMSVRPITSKRRSADGDSDGLKAAS